MRWSPPGDPRELAGVGRVSDRGQAGSYRRLPRQSAGAERRRRTPSSLASRTSCSACAFVAEYGAAESGRSGTRLVALHDRLARQDRGLGPAVDEPPHPCCAAGVESVSGSFDVALHEVIPLAPLLHVRGEVEGDVAAPRSLGHGLHIAQVSTCGTRAQNLDGRGGAIGAGKCGHLASTLDEAPDQSPADEAGTAGNEGRAGNRGHGASVVPFSGQSYNPD